MIKTANENYVKKALQGSALVNHIWQGPQVGFTLRRRISNIRQEAAPRLCLVPVSKEKQCLRAARICLPGPPACRSRAGTSLLL